MQKSTPKRAFLLCLPSIDKGRHGFDGQKCAHTASSPLTIRQVFSAGLFLSGHWPLPAHRVGRSFPAARRQRNPQGRGRDGPRRADVSLVIEAAARRGTARPRPGSGRQDTHQAPGQPPHHPRDAAATDPPKQNQGGGGPRSAAHRRRKSDVAPARPGPRQPPGRRDGATHAAVGGRSTATEKHTPSTPKHHASEEATKGGSRRIPLCVRPFITGWCGEWSFVLPAKNMHTHQPPEKGIRFNPP